MRIMVTGAGGLLGSHLCALYPDETIPLTHAECDITNQWDIENALNDLSPNVVINCAGVVSSPVVSDGNLFETNTKGTYLLARECALHGSFLIHISTDCVFHEDMPGQQQETDFPFPNSMYGWSKLLGEPLRFPNTVTIRTSFVGWPDPKGRSLLSWFYHAKEPCGYSEWMWNGLTTVELSKVLIQFARASQSVHPLESNLYHIHGETVSKWHVLNDVNNIFGWEKPLGNSWTPRSRGRVLASHYDFYKAPPLRKMLLEMYDKQSLLESVMT